MRAAAPFLDTLFAAGLLIPSDVAGVRGHGQDFERVVLHLMR
jgi:hypothetical protein